MSQESEITPPSRTRKRIAKVTDPTIEAIEDLEEQVSSQETRAIESLRQRWDTVGTSVAKMAIGAAAVSDTLFHNIGFLSGDKPDIMITIIGAAVVVWGMRDAGEIPERFSRARQLVADSRFLRATLTRNTADAIEGIPFKRLEQMESQPSLRTPPKESTH